MARSSSPRRALLLALITPALAITACSREQAAPGLDLLAQAQPSSHARMSADAAEIVSAKASMSGEWRLVAIDRTQLSEGGSPTVIFGKEGKCWGSTGVNDFRTTFTLEGLKFGRLKVGNAAVTRKMGPPEAMALEKLFLDRLESAISYEVRGDLLYLHSGENQNLTFERIHR